MLISAGEIRGLRHRSGLTQAELARRSGVSQSLIARIEKGGVDPRASTLGKISCALVGDACPKTAEDVMCRPVIYLVPDETVSDAIEKMRRFNISQLPVMEKGKQIGAVTDSEIVRQMAGKSTAELGSTKARNLMTKPFPEVEKGQKQSDVMVLLQKRSAVLVVDNGAVCGIISKADALRMIA